MSSRIDPAVVAAVQRARVPGPKYLVPILKSLIFHAWFLPSTLALTPYWVLRSLIPMLRAHPRQDFYLSFVVFVIRYALGQLCWWRFQPIAPREGGLRERRVLGTLLSVLNYSGPGGWVKPDGKVPLLRGTKRLDLAWFDAAPLDYFRGVLTIRTQGPGASVRRVQDCATYAGPALLEPRWAKTRTRGFWFMHRRGVAPSVAKPPQGQPRSVILWFHGGANVTLAAGDLIMGDGLAKWLARGSSFDVFSVDYDLAPRAPFPACVSQAVSAWHYLVHTLGYQPSQIVIGGDSYGSQLTLQLERFLRTELPKVDPERYGSQWPKPLGLLLLSPWLALRDGAFATRKTNLRHDILPSGYPVWGLAAMGVNSPKNPLSAEDPWLSPAYLGADEMRDMPPMFVTNGEFEALLDEGKAFVERAKASGVEARYEVLPLMPHDSYGIPLLVGRMLPRYRTFGAWIRALEKAHG